MKNSTLQKIAIFSSALFVGASAVYVYSPTFGSHAAESKDAEVNLTVNSSLALRTSADELNLEANVGSFVSGTVDVDVITNSQYGYTLTLEDSDDDASMVHTNTSISDTVTSLYAGAKTSSTMTDNTWGFSLDNTNFYMIPTLNNPVALKQTTGAVSGDYDRTPVDFGAKVGMTLTAGAYTDTVKFTAYVNGADNSPAEAGVELLQPGTPPETRTLKDLSTLQEINTKICANTPDHETATLRDVRDNKMYTTAKLKDGHCWITKNLELSDYDITSADSDVPDGYTFHVPKPEESETSPGGPNPGYFQYKYIYLDPVYGGYYNYYTAVGGWDGATLDIDVNSPQSICPKGWRLPVGTYFAEWDELWQVYKREGNYKLTALMGDVARFNLNGQISGNLGASPEGQGEYGSWWSSSGYQNYSFAQYMYIKSNPNSDYDSANTSSYASPSYGFGVRCIAR